jgi:hypothetical protein
MNAVALKTTRNRCIAKLEKQPKAADNNHITQMKKLTEKEAQEIITDGVPNKLYCVALHNPPSHDPSAEAKGRFLSLMSMLETSFNRAKQSTYNLWFIVTELNESSLNDVLENIFQPNSFNLIDCRTPPLGTPPQNALGTLPQDGSLPPEIQAWIDESYPNIHH